MELATPLPTPGRDGPTSHPVRYGTLTLLGVPVVLAICPAPTCGWYGLYQDQRGAYLYGEGHAGMTDYEHAAQRFGLTFG